MRKLVYFLLFCSSTTFASMQSDLKSAFEKINVVSNTTPAYEAQSVGYYSGGSMYARSAVRNQNIANITLPKTSAGCGGIDMHFGGFSFITNDQAKNLAKNIMGDAVSYGFNIALETISPLIANSYKDLRNVVNEVNNMNINSCETAVGLVGSVFPKTEESQRQICQSLANQSGYFSDYANARMECGNSSSRQGAFDELRKKGGYEDFLLDDLNFAWKAITSNPLFSNDQELAEVMMSVSGTIIYKSGGRRNNAQKHQLPSLAISEDFINALMNGGKIKIYRCDDKLKCLNPYYNADSILNIDQKNSFVGMVSAKLNSITEKIRSNDSPLSASEIEFINSTSLPIYKMLNVHAAFSRGLSAFDLTMYSELIAADILYRYLEESINEVLRKARMLQLPESEYKEFIKGIEIAKQNIRNKKIDNYNANTQRIQMIEQSMLIEKRLASQLEKPFKDAMAWAENLQG